MHQNTPPTLLIWLLSSYSTREHAEHVLHRKIVPDCGVCFMFAVNTLRPGLGLPGLQLPPLPGLPPPPGGVGFWMSFICGWTNSCGFGKKNCELLGH